MNGLSELTASHLEPIFRRMVAKLVKLAACGWQPRQDIDSFVVWAPRKYNAVADHSMLQWTTGKVSSNGQTCHLDLRVCFTSAWTVDYVDCTRQVWRPMLLQDLDAR